MSLENIAPIMQLGFAAAMCVLIWRGYERITGTLVDVVKDNTAALAELKSVITEHTHVTERMQSAVEALNRRVGTLEDREKRP